MRPYLRVANVYEDRIDTSDVMEMDFGEADFKRFQLFHGDILLNEGQSHELVGRPAMFRDEVPNCCFTNSLVRFRAGPTTDKAFSFQMFRYFMHSGEFMKIAKHTTNISHLGAGRFAEMIFPLPPLNEQKRIVAKIDALTEKSREAREALDEVPQLLDKLRQSILAAAFRGDLTARWREQNPDVEPASRLLERIRKERRTRWEEAELAKMKARGQKPKDDIWKAKYTEPEPVDTEGLPELPEGWCWSSMNELTLMSGGITKGQKRKERTVTRSVPYLRVANVQRGSLSLSEVLEIEATNDQIEQLRLLPGDLLLNEGGDIDKLGRGWVWRGEIETCIHQNHVFRARPVTPDLDPEFVSHFTNTYGQRYFLDSGKQTTNLASVSMTRVKACPVPVAPSQEMAAVVTEIRRALSLLSTLIETHASFLAGVNTLDTSILAKAFRGELVPQDPSDEPASVLLERIRAEREAAGGGKKRTRQESR